MKEVVGLLGVVVLMVWVSTPPVTALNNGLGLTPQMGYNSWYDLLCTDAMNETTIKDTVDAMTELGLHRLGYEYINLDDCWAKGRQQGSGVVYPDYAKFPSGLKALADYVHSKGMKFGVYTDRGNLTCGGRPGSLNYEKIDALTYASWGVDYLKEDSCYASQDHATAAQEYATMRDALNATNRPIFFSLCGWNPWYAPFGRSLGNSWRIGPDDGDWSNILININNEAQLGSWSGPGGWNDPCLLINKANSGSSYITELQSRTQFNMWAIMSAPLLISGDVRKMSSFLLQTYMNYEVIRVNQDPLGRQGIRLVGGDLQAPSSQVNHNIHNNRNIHNTHNTHNKVTTASSTTNVWGRPLADGSWAVVFINVDSSSHNIACSYADCLQFMGFLPSDTIRVRDLWQHATIGAFVASNGYTATQVAAAGGSVMLKFTIENF